MYNMGERCKVEIVKTKKRKRFGYDHRSSGESDEEVEARLKDLHIERLRIRISQQSEAVQYHSELSAAFKDDCEAVLAKFSNKECFSYESFAELWQSIRFGELFQFNMNKEHYGTYLENCFFQLKKYIIFSSNLCIKVGAFYMIYSIYSKKRGSNMIKVRWSHQEYLTLLRLLEEVENYTYDFMFILNKMFSNAFLYVGKTRRWGIEPKYAYEEKQLLNDIFGNDVNMEMVKSKLYSTNFHSINIQKDVQKEYDEGLMQYLEEYPEARAFCDFQPITLAEDISKSFKDIEFKPVEVKEEVIVEESVLSKRRAIRNKAFQSQNHWFLDTKVINDN